MKFFFANTDPQGVLDNIHEELKGRKLGKMLSFKFRDDDLIITISKLGKSIIEFSHEDDEEGFHWTLSKEKIAFSHRAFKTEVLEKLCGVVEKVGGKFVE